VIVAGFRKCRDLVREGKVFIKDKAKVASRVGCSERRVVNFRKLLFKSDKKKLSFRRVESKVSFPLPSFPHPFPPFPIIPCPPLPFHWCFEWLLPVAAEKGSSE